MSNFLALSFDIKPGHEAEVARLFEESGRPDHTVVDEHGTVKGALLCTNVFMKDQTVIRVIEFEGDFLDVGRHMSQQTEVQALEAALDEHLVEPRDMVTREGAARFFASAAMKTVISR
jgi:hypothetical protein